MGCGPSGSNYGGELESEAIFFGSESASGGRMKVAHHAVVGLHTGKRNQSRQGTAEISPRITYERNLLG